MIKIKGAIFDMDGTLVDSLMIWDVIWRELGKHFLNNENFRPTEEEDKAVRTMTMEQAMNYLHSIYAMGNSGKDLLAAANEIIKNFYANEVELKKGVLEFLEYCYNNDIKMCIASATERKMLGIAIEHCQIGKYFRKIFSCAEIGKGKDQPDIYLMALDYLGTDKKETWVFEDSLVAIKTAGVIGLCTVGIYDKYNYGQAEIEKVSTVYISEGETLEKLMIDKDWDNQSS